MKITPSHETKKPAYPMLMAAVAMSAMIAPSLAQEEQGASGVPIPPPQEPVPAESAEPNPVPAEPATEPNPVPPPQKAPERVTRPPRHDVTIGGVIRSPRVRSATEPGVREPGPPPPRPALRPVRRPVRHDRPVPGKWAPRPRVKPTPEPTETEQSAQTTEN